MHPGLVEYSQTGLRLRCEDITVVDRALLKRAVGPLRWAMPWSGSTSVSMPTCRGVLSRQRVGWGTADRHLWGVHRRVPHAAARRARSASASRSWSRARSASSAATCGSRRRRSASTPRSAAAPANRSKRCSPSTGPLISATGHDFWPAWYLMAAGAIGAVAVYFSRETANQPLWGSGPSVSTEAEARELVRDSAKR
jgi:hypothetical protein